MKTWKELLTQEVEDISSKYKIPPHRGFIVWFIKATEDLPVEQILELITDQSKDGGIDAIYIDDDFKKVKVYQSKFSRFIGESPFNKDELTKLSKVYDFLEGRIDIQELKDYVNQRLKDKLDKAIRVIKEEGYAPELFFITTHKNNENSAVYNNSYLPLNIISSRELEFKFREWQHGHTPELGTINLPFTGILNGPNAPNGYIVNVKSNTLRGIYIKHKEKLFSRNVRIFYGEIKKKGSPNFGMKETLINSPSNFWYFNNGITILAQEIKVKSDEKVITLKNPQIINGCQTISIIGTNKENEAELFAKVIEISDNMINQDLIDGIIESNNRQNPVDERILKSNHPLQVALARKLESLGYYYERKEKQYSEEAKKSHSIKRLIRINNLDLVKANIALVQPPHYAVSDSENELFSIRFKDVFQEQKSHLEYVIPYLLWEEIKIIGSNFRKNSKDRKTFHQLGSYHLLRFIYDNCPDLHTNSKQMDIFKLLHTARLEMPTAGLHDLFDILFNIYKKSENYGTNSGQRDFFKNKDLYTEFVSKVSRSAKRDMEYLFAGELINY